MCSVFKSLLPKTQNQLDKPVCFTHANVLLSYVNEIVWTRDQIAICWIIEKAREFQKIIYFCFIDYAKTFDCVDHNKYQTTWTASWETCMQVRKQQLELDMDNRLFPNRKRSTSRLYIVTLLI